MDTSPHSALLRQRRNLILMSCFIIVVTLTGANVSELSILGTKINIPEKNTFWIPIFIGLVFFYFVVRYHLYLKSGGYVQTAWQECMDEAATQLGKTAEFFEEKFNGDKDRKLFCRFEEYTNSEKRGYHLKLWKTGNLQKEETTTPAKEIPEPAVRLVYRSSLYIFCTKKTAFTEYIMPYLLAGLAFVLFFTEFILTYLLSGLGLIFFLIDLWFSSP